MAVIDRGYMKNTLIDMRCAYYIALMQGHSKFIAIVKALRILLLDIQEKVIALLKIFKK